MVRVELGLGMVAVTGWQMRQRQQGIKSVRQRRIESRDLA